MTAVIFIGAYLLIGVISINLWKKVTGFSDPMPLAGILFWPKGLQLTWSYYKMDKEYQKAMQEHNLEKAREALAKWRLG